MVLGVGVMGWINPEKSLATVANGPRGVFVLVIAALLASTACELEYSEYASATSGDSAWTVVTNKSNLHEVLQTGDIDKIVRALNDIKKPRYQGEILPFIEHLWEERSDLYTDLPWAVLGSDRVKVDIADIILQAKRNGNIERDVSDVNNFVRAAMDSDDKEVAMHAVLAAVSIETSETIEHLKRIALKQEKPTFRAAILSLASMCHSDAVVALASIESSLISQSKTSRAEYVKGQIESQASFRERICPFRQW